MCKCVCDHCILPWTISSVKRNYFDGRFAWLLYLFRAMLYVQLFYVCMYLLQVPSWAWEMYRRSWTAYPAERWTRTCPVPMRRLLLMARIHEGQHSCPVRLLLPPLPPPPRSSSSFIALPPSTLYSITKMLGESGMQGGKAGVATVLPPCCSWTHNPLSYPFSHNPLQFLCLANMLRESIFHCYIRDFLLRESRWVWGTKWGVEDWMEWEERCAD